MALLFYFIYHDSKVKICHFHFLKSLLKCLLLPQCRGTHKYITSQRKTTIDLAKNKLDDEC